MRSESQFEPRLSALDFEILFLYQHGVPYEVLSSTFGLTENHLRVLVKRARSRSSHKIQIVSQPLSEYWRMGNWDRVAFERDSKAEELWNKVESIDTGFGGMSGFQNAIAELKRMLPFVGHIKNPVRRRLFARIHQQIAWSYQHLGYSRSALRHADLAIWLYNDVHNELGEKYEFKYLAEAGLIAALAARLLGDYDQSFAYLALVKSSYDRLGVSPGSEYFRQQAVLFLKEDEREAKKLMLGAAHAMYKNGEANSDLDVRLSTERHMNIALSDVESAWSLSAEVTNKYGRNSLLHGMLVNCAAAAALSTDSLNEHVKALDVLHQEALSISPFAHQATVAKLLMLTPQLGLTNDLRREWIIRAQSANAFRKF